ncbi:MAG: YggS family pyridoxal phosphate-dependent enzyme [Clostridia bacterium]|nr:YggS family pyridoxal phosphate-dependent enzyme [Clostridia bacterium]
MDIAANLERINVEIQTALLKAKNPKEKVMLVPVTKNRSISEINKVIAAGYQVLGENRVQELQEKFPQVPTNIEWHLIGHLQRNKVKYITDKVRLIHSLDSYKLALEINRRMQPQNRPMNCLIQVNVAMEKNKHGLEMQEVIPFLEEVSLLPFLKIKGLMTIAPQVDDPEEVRPIFRELAKLFASLKKKDLPNVEMDFLSMGMTNDFSVAVEEGANIVRIGSAIFGPR